MVLWVCCNIVIMCAYWAVSAVVAQMLCVVRYISLASLTFWHAMVSRSAQHRLPRQWNMALPQKYLLYIQSNMLAVSLNLLRKSQNRQTYKLVNYDMWVLTVVLMLLLLCRLCYICFMLSVSLIFYRLLFIPAYGIPCCRRDEDTVQLLCTGRICLGLFVCLCLSACLPAVQKSYKQYFGNGSWHRKQL